jgi:two-component system, NarL family, invasion response regulator UvrY
MVVDDTAIVRRMLVRALSNCDDLAVVAEATDGYEAIELVRRTRPDAVIMDIKMPGMGGVEATALIKAEFPDVEILAYSSDGSFRQAAIDAGASAFVMKDVRVTGAAFTTPRIGGACRRPGIQAPARQE